MDLIIIKGESIAGEVEAIKDLLGDGEHNCEIIADETNYNFINSEIVFEGLAGVATVIQFLLWGKEFIYDKVNLGKQSFVKNNTTYNVDSIKETPGSDKNSSNIVITVEGKAVDIAVQSSDGIFKIEIKNQLELTI